MTQTSYLDRSSLNQQEIEPDNTFALYLPTPGWELKFKYHDFSKFWWLKHFC
jgi:hypothetical protein